MNVLILGNSQAGTLKRSYDQQEAQWAEAGINLFFYVIPGGMGPNVSVKNDRLEVGAFSAEHPPYVSPADMAQSRISDFDAVVFSALGYFDGGFAYKNPITTCGVLSEFSPRGLALKQALVSEDCFEEMMAEQFRGQPGFEALYELAGVFDGSIVIQPFPNISDQILEHSDWGLRQWYTNPVGAYKFMAGVKESFLTNVTKELGARLLDYPVTCDRNGMTPRSMMREVDLVHQNDHYGDLVLKQLRQALPTRCSSG